MPKPKPFVFNDESVANSYGFIIPTSGISLKRFKQNPIMLDSHWNSTKSVLGKWEDVKVDNGQLTGVPVFDSEDEDVTKIQGKVERGFIKSCSMGVTFRREDLKMVAGKLVLEKCELYEVSIVAVPSNANSIRLYAPDSDTPLKDEEVKDLCLSIEGVDPNIETQNENNDKMKITLTQAAALALGFAATQLEHDVEDVNAAIGKLSAEKTAAELKLEILENDKKEAAKKAIENKVELAIKAGKIPADKKEKFVSLGLADEALLDDTLGSIPAKKSLAAQIENTGEDAGEVKSMDDFQKLDDAQQLAFKNDQPEAYKKLLTQIK
ncbi:HK97 family phage prohead protease [Mesoflavibacter sp. CH_XMU1404-2]|uniref:HK97 family phage prohead protease n=1 Tax=Mesoflavibacter sp. CH_XMU1404-2 TaxID=3107766 RepID=UPI003009E3C7